MCLSLPPRVRLCTGSAEDKNFRSLNVLLSLAQQKCNGNIIHVIMIVAVINLMLLHIRIVPACIMHFLRDRYIYIYIGYIPIATYY